MKGSAWWWPFASYKYKREIPEIKNLTCAVSLSYKDGDILVFEHPGRLDDKTFERLKGQLDSMFGSVNIKKAIVLEDGMKLNVVLSKCQ